MAWSTDYPHHGCDWPYSRKVVGGSSIIDILVYIETVQRGRRVFLDFRSNPENFRFEDLEAEALAWAAEINTKSPTGQRMAKFAFNLIDDGLVGQQLFAGEATPSGVRLNHSTPAAP